MPNTIPTRLFRVMNRANCGLWVAASSEGEAERIALRFAHIKRCGNARIKDQTDHMLNAQNSAAHASLHSQLMAGVKGVGAVRIPAQEWVFVEQVNRSAVGR